MVPRKYVTVTSDHNSNVVPAQPPSAKGFVKKEILYEKIYYDVTEWIQKHPGGKVIEYYTHSGEDATIAVKQFHQRSTKKVLAIMNTLKKRPATESEMNRTISPRHKALDEDFMKLFQDFQDEGLFKPAIPNLIVRLLELMAFAGFGFYFIHSGIIYEKIFAYCCLTMYFGRTGWIQHEGGHHSLTGKPGIDRFIQQFVWGVGNGMAGSWWRSQHNRHHAMPQRMQRDVDLDTLPLIAFNAEVVKNPKHGKSFFVQYQAILFLGIDTLIVAVLWKFYLHPRYVLKKKLYLEMVIMATHYVMLYHMGFANYVFAMWLASIYLFGNFALSHTHLPVTNEPLHWVEYALLHTTNIRPSWWCDWWMGYLNYQIEHHLFPTMPQFRHPLIVPRIRALADKHGIPYKCESYGQALVDSFSNLNQVANEFNHH